jgi:hypothetical protein
VRAGTTVVLGCGAPLAARGLADPRGDVANATTTPSNNAAPAAPSS